MASSSEMAIPSSAVSPVSNSTLTARVLGSICTTVPVSLLAP